MAGQVFGDLKEQNDITETERVISCEEDVAHLLPKFDPYIMGYKNRQRLISKENEKSVYWSVRGEVSPAVLLNGQIVGTWNYKEEKGKLTITLALFEKMGKAPSDLIRQEAEKIVCFFNGGEYGILVRE